MHGPGTSGWALITPASVVVVAGNGPSLLQIAPGRIVAGDVIVRVNSFFLEPRFVLGPRADIAFLAGDPLVAPFLCASLAQAVRRGGYALGGWASDDPRVARTAHRHLRGVARLTVPSPPPEVAALLARLGACGAGRRLMAGTRALLLAHALGARRIVLAGIDLYQNAGPGLSGPRYAFTPGPRQCALLGADLATRGPDRGLHDPALDLAVIMGLARLPGVALWRAGPAPALEGVLDLAPARVVPTSGRTSCPTSGRALASPAKPPMADWVGRAGPWPAAALALARRGAALWRRRPGAGGERATGPGQSLIGPRP